MEKLDENTQKVLSSIEDSEKRIVKQVSNLNVASTYGNAFDQLEAKANTARTDIRQALTAKTDDEKAVAIANNVSVTSCHNKTSYGFYYTIGGLFCHCTFFMVRFASAWPLFY